VCVCVCVCVLEKQRQRQRDRHRQTARQTDIQTDRISTDRHNGNGGATRITTLRKRSQQTMMMMLVEVLVVMMVIIDDDDDNEEAGEGGDVCWYCVGTAAATAVGYPDMYFTANCPPIVRQERFQICCILVSFLVFVVTLKIKIEVN